MEFKVLNSRDYGRTLFVILVCDQRKGRTSLLAACTQIPLSLENFVTYRKVVLKKIQLSFQKMDHGLGTEEYLAD